MARSQPYNTICLLSVLVDVSDDDAEKYIKIFTSLEKDVIDNLIEEHRQDPGRRTLQYRLAEELPVWFTLRKTLIWR